VQRALVVGALALLLAGGLAELEAWPMTAWRLFSEQRTAEQSGWALETIDENGDVTGARLDDLPMGYRLAGWALGELPRSPSPDGTALCRVLLEEIRADRPEAQELRVLRTRRRLVEEDATWRSVEVSSEVVAECAGVPVG
jgi:hypothetical protein